MQLVRKTQKDWKCNQCLDVIKTGTPMIRNSINRWQTLVYCLDCGKPMIEEALESAKESLKVFEKHKSDNPKSAYMMFKQNVEHFENILKIYEVER